MKHIECKPMHTIGYCSDNDCPCSVTPIKYGGGYLLISPEVVKFRKTALSQAELQNKLTPLLEKKGHIPLQDYEPILICKQAAVLRNVDLSIARKDAKNWWETQRAPLRVTPSADDVNHEFAANKPVTNTTLPGNPYIDYGDPYEYEQAKHKKKRKKINFLGIIKKLFISISILSLLGGGTFYSIKNYSSIQSYFTNIIEQFKTKFAHKEEVEIQEEPQRIVLTKDFFNNAYSFKDNQYYGNIRFADLTENTGSYRQSVNINGKNKTFYVYGTFRFDLEKIIFRPKKANSDIVWMMESIDLETGNAIFFDPENTNREEAIISLGILKETKNKIIISSNPSNATVIINGKTLGNSPYTWNNSSFYGTCDIVIKKDGYLDGKIRVEFMGGIIKKHVELVKHSETLNQTPIGTVDSTAIKPLISTKNTKKPSKKDNAPGTIFLSSIPPVAEVYMDGKKIGMTNIDDCPITAGVHTMLFVKGSKRLEKKMTFTKGKNPSQLIRLKQ